MKGGFISVITITALVYLGSIYSENISKESLEFVQILKTVQNEIFFKTLSGLETDASGNLFAMDNRMHTVFKLDKEGHLLKKFGQHGQGPGDLMYPIHSSISQNKFLVCDNNGVSIFDLEGKFLNRFRVFTQFNSISVLDESVFILHPDVENLITMYDLNGKRISQFGEKYKIPYSLYQKFPYQGTISWMFHQGKLLSGPGAVFFISYLFGDIFKFDLKGKLLNKLELLDVKYLRERKKDFFDVGWDNGAKVGIEPRYFIDAKYLDGRIFLLHPGDKDESDIFLVLDDKNLKIKKIYEVPKMAEKEKTNRFELFGVISVGNAYHFFISFQSELSGDILIRHYKSTNIKEVI